MRLELTEAQMEFLRGLLSEESERARDHLDWLQSAAAHAEEDKERQTAESERSIEMADQLLAVLDGNGGQKFRWPLATLAVGESFICPIEERLTRAYCARRGRELGPPVHRHQGAFR